MRDGVHGGQGALQARALAVLPREDEDTSRTTRCHDANLTYADCGELPAR